MAPGRADAETGEERGLAPNRLLRKSPPLPPERSDRAWAEVPASERPRGPQAGGAASLHVSGQVLGGPASAPWEARCRPLHGDQQRPALGWGLAVSEVEVWGFAGPGGPLHSWHREPLRSVSLLSDLLCPKVTAVAFTAERAGLPWPRSRPYCTHRLFSQVSWGRAVQGSWEP